MDLTPPPNRLIGLLLLFSVFYSLFLTAQTPYIVTSTRLNVRKLPSAESVIIGSLSKGDTVNVQELRKSWAKIDFKNSSGYVTIKYIQPIHEEQQPQDTEPETSITEDTDAQEYENPQSEIQTDNEWPPQFFNHLHFRLTSTLSLGLSNFYSFNAYSYPRFGFGLDAGVQLTADFMPENMFSEMTLGFIELGNSNYSFPSFMINIMPIGYREDIKGISTLKDSRWYAVGGLVLQTSGSHINFSRNSHSYDFVSKPSINLYIKSGIEINKNAAVGIMFMHGLTNVCRNISIGIKHSTIQVYGSFLFDQFDQFKGQ